MGLFDFLLGNGRLKPELRAELESEGLVMLEEGLVGSIRYDHFRAPGKRFNGKVTGVRVAVGISRERLVVYSHSGRVELVDSPFSSPRLGALEPSVDTKGRLSLRIDYARMPEAAANGVEGIVTIRARTPNAAHLAADLTARLPR